MAARTRTLRLERGERVQGVCVVGSHLSIDVNGAAPAEAQWFSMRHSQNIDAEICNSDTSKMRVLNGETLWSLGSGTVTELSMNTPSVDSNDAKITFAYFGPGADTPIEKAGVYLTGVEISLDVDADRDGIVEKNNPNKASWTWGPEGQGAILLVNCDKDSPISHMKDGDDEVVFAQKDLEDMSRMVLRTRGPEKLPNGYHLLLHISVSDSDKIGVFLYQNKMYSHVLGRSKLYYKMRYTGVNEREFFVEGLRFPDETFPGLVTVSVSLLETMIQGIPEAPIYTDIVSFRMSPLIITPNVLEPLEVFVCSVKDNYLFLKEIKSLVCEAHYKISICFEYVNRGDRWMQDEMEFGYIQAPHKSFPVVLDSPREGPLKDFPIKEILRADFGYVSKNALCPEVTSLDSFGNLEVSPPVTVNGKEYPLGRIILGSSFPTTNGRRMTKVVREFLYAQQVQAPVELYSDWLLVGLVNEFMTFVPAPDRKGFRLLLASPLACFKLFQEKKKDGHGDAAMFQGLETKRYTISKILSTDTLEQENIYVQRCIDWNRDILKQELGLTEEDIIDIPALFMLEKNEKNGKASNNKALNGKAVAFFPNMVNMIVLGNELGIPKPFGPIIKETCCLEENIHSLLLPLELNCTFIDDIVSYHQKLGEVHCGTNVRRKPFAFKWWNMVP